ncbi:MAG: ZPR1 zinc finger domain-containing protein [Thermoplasmata archaeon]
MKIVSERVEVCPICNKKTLKCLDFEDDIPYFGRVMNMLVNCENCGYRHTDFIFLEEHEPLRLEIRVSGAEDLKIRVARSAYGTIIVPELGVMVQPITMGDAYITNVEGVFSRIIKIIMQLYRDSSGEEKDRLLELLKKIGLMRAGKAALTLVIEDPTGNSKIISDKVTKKVIS